MLKKSNLSEKKGDGLDECIQYMVNCAFDTLKKLQLFEENYELQDEGAQDAQNKVYKVNFLGKTIARNCVELKSLEKALTSNHPD